MGSDTIITMIIRLGEHDPERLLVVSDPIIAPIS